MENITYAINILGNTVIGGMVASMVIINIPVKLTNGKDAQTIQGLLDSMMPALLPLLITFLFCRLLKKDVKVIYILLAILIVSVLGAIFGFFSV